MYKKICILFVLTLSACGSLTKKQAPPKTEFRGFWVATVVNIDWPKKPSDPIEKKKADYLELLDFYQSLHFNAAIVQIRTAGDAFYSSELAPWSRFLTGTEGEAGEEYTSLLHWMIEETHKRGMEFHAWLNPYRATFDLNTDILSDSHDFNTHPDWLLRYGKKYYYNPGLPKVQQHILNVIKEVVENYDIDAIHFDDYFYPYKIQGEEFKDTATYEEFALPGQNIDDWRRENVNTLIKQIHLYLKSAKPWVQFGISPFGVWRNADKDPKGSDTRAGQTTYDDLYADPITWMQNQWIDYMAPQLYWSMDYEVASHRKLVDWWSKNAWNTPIYIGNGTYKIRNNADTQWNRKKQIPRQIQLSRATDNINGNIFFSAKSLINRHEDVVNYLKRKVYTRPALTPGTLRKETVKLFSPEIKTSFQSASHYTFVLENVPHNTKKVLVYSVRNSQKLQENNGEYILSIAPVDKNNAFHIAKEKIRKRQVWGIRFIDRYGNKSEMLQVEVKKEKSGGLALSKKI